MDYTPNIGFDSNTPSRYVFGVHGVRITDPLHNLLEAKNKKKKKKEKERGHITHTKKITIDRLQCLLVLIYLCRLL